MALRSKKVHMLRQHTLVGMNGVEVQRQITQFPLKSPRFCNLFLPPCMPYHGGSFSVRQAPLPVRSKCTSLLGQFV